ncbi:MAG: cysteine desulfurase [Ectothiorhodospiraceae bacterium]|nr:cysteine desulfurase [Ectothiorhodospiraceae bacterium]
MYLDNNASTPIDERVLETMLPYLRGQYGNPSSVYQLGRMARAAIDVAREQVATLVNAHPSQVVFTSGGTEANNLALKGAAGRLLPGSLAISAVEHGSVRAPAQALRKQGWVLSEVGVDTQGRLDMMQLNEVISSHHMSTASTGVPGKSMSGKKKPGKIVAVMLANNETGVIHNVVEVAELARENGALLFVDAVQAAGKIPVDFKVTGAQMMSLSAHKMYGPKGAGALIVDKSTDMEPLLHGGGHEKGRRTGTENVAAIVGFGKAAELAMAEMELRHQRVQPLREHLEQRVMAEMPEVKIFAQEAERLPNTSFFAVPGVDGETLLMSLDQAGLAVSSGSACSTGETDPSHVLMAMGVDKALARGAIRVSLGKDSQRNEIDRFVDCLKQQVQALQRFAAVAYA